MPSPHARLEIYFTYGALAKTITSTELVIYVTQVHRSDEFFEVFLLFFRFYTYTEGTWRLSHEQFECWHDSAWSYKRSQRVTSSLLANVLNSCYLTIPAH